MLSPEKSELICLHDAVGCFRDNVLPQGARSKLHDFVLTCIEKPTTCDVCFKLLRLADYSPRTSSWWYMCVISSCWLRLGYIVKGQLHHRGSNLGSTELVQLLEWVQLRVQRIWVAPLIYERVLLNLSLTRDLCRLFIWRTKGKYLASFGMNLLRMWKSPPHSCLP